MTIVKDVHDLADGLPRSGYGELKAQMKRAAISIPCNVAEGANRGSDRDFRRFLGIALGSCGELETQVEMVRMLEIADEARIAELDEHVVQEGRMLRKMMQAI